MQMSSCVSLEAEQAGVHASYKEVPLPMQSQTQQALQMQLQAVAQPPPPLLEGADEMQKRALEDTDDPNKRKVRRVQVKNKCEHDRWKDGRCKDCLCKHKVKRGDCKDGCNEVTPFKPPPSEGARHPRMHATRP